MRITFLKAAFALLFFCLLADLFWMQIVNGAEYLRKSENNRIRLVPEESTRGIILDRNNVPLVENKIVFDVVAVPQEISPEQKDDLFKRLSLLLGVSPQVISDTFIYNYDSGFSPIMLASDVPKETAFLIEQEMINLPGIFIKTRAKRNYIYGPATAHLIGYVGKMTEGEFPELKKYGYQIKDVIGRNGLEKSYDDKLRGKSGGMQLEVNSKGKIINVLSYRPPLAGEDIYTTIDIKLQNLIYQLAGEEKAAVCVMNADTGEILALFSGPSFDPNMFIDRKRGKEIEEIFRDKNSPLLNRCLNAYAPGSIFKIVTAYAALKEKIIDLNTVFDCSGEFKIGNSTRFCWLRRGHGPVNVVHALTTSCNVFFWNVGLRSGENIIARYAEEFGLGKLTNIDLPAENKGVVPNARWKRSALHQKWFGGDTVNFAIGQGYLLVSPVQAVRVAAMVANGGYEVWPHLQKRPENISGRKKVLSSEELNIVKDGMRGVVEAEDGTGSKVRIPGIQVFAKTGTAQFSGQEAHAWFFGFSPLPAGNICFAVFIENGGHGGERPAEISREIINYFAEQKNKDSI